MAETDNKPVVSQEQENSWLKDLEKVDQLMEQEDLKNAKYRRRVAWLLPFNAFCLWATIRYSKSIQKIAKIFWPNRQKATLSNLFLIGTAQALVFTTFYLGGSIAILGINPISIIKRREYLIGGPTDAELQADEDVIQKSVEGMSVSDAVVLRVFKSMGLSDRTMMMIEKDLRVQQQEAKKEAAK